MSPDASGDTRRPLLFAVAFAALLLGHVLLMGTLRIYPFTDLPFHLAAATVVKHLHDPETPIAATYDANVFPRPNVFHLLFCAHVFSSVETANRVLLCAYVVALPVIVLLLLRRIGGDPWLALLSFPALYHYNLGWGFIGFSLAVPAVLLFVYVLLRYDRNPSPGSGIALAGIGVLLFAIHALAALFALLVFAVTLLGSRREGPLRLARRALPALPLVASMIAWWLLDPDGRSGDLGFLGAYYREEYVASLAKRIKFYHFDNRDLFDGKPGYFVAFLFYAPLFLALGVSAIRRGREWIPAAWRTHRPVVALLAAALACYFLLPDRIPQQWVLYERFLVFIALGAILATSVAFMGRHPFWLRSALLLLATAHLVLYASYYSAFQRENEPFTAWVFPERREPVMASIVYADRFRGRPVYIHFANYRLVWDQGVVVTDLVGFRYSWVERKKSAERLPAFDAWMKEHDHYDGRYDACDYLLVRGEIPAGHATALGAFVPERIAESHDARTPVWRLYRNTAILPRSLHPLR